MMAWQGHEGIELGGVSLRKRLFVNRYSVVAWRLRRCPSTSLAPVGPFRFQLSELKLSAFRKSALLARIHRQHPVALDLDFAMTAKQLEQNGDALPGRHDARDQDAHAAQGTPGNHHLGAGLRIGRDFDRLVVADEGAQFDHDRVGHRRNVFAEMDDAGHAGEGVDLATALEIFEPGEEITGEESFGRPHWLACPHPAEADARREDFEAKITLKKYRDLVFLSRSGVKTIPVQGKKLKAEN